MKIMEKIVIQSDISQQIEVEKFVSDICDIYNINNYAATISMSRLQAVENAIVHGNKNDSKKTVTVSFEKCRGGVAFSVSDQGSGFDFNNFSSNEPQGTGIFMMKTLSDKLSFSNNGSTVRMEFVINGIEASRALERIVLLHNFYAPALVNA